jgi:predicted acetyltransferase
VQVREAGAADLAALATLWTHLLDVDPTRTVHDGHLAVDNPLLALLADRDAAWPERRDWLWARLIDLPAALAARRYAADLSLDIAQLGALYLGGRSLLQLAAAGLVEVVRPDRLPEASAAFGWPLAPGCSWVF